jgi:pilus assembly protein CpaB
MNRRLLVILTCAFILAAGASYVVYRVVGTQLNARARPQTTRVVMAAHDLEIGTLIRDTDLKMGELVGALPKGAITKPDALVGRGVTSTLYAGEPIIESRLAPAGSGGGLAATIPPGMRACAVKVNDVVGVAGFVLPGMRVDVLISGNVPGVASTEGPKVRTLLQNIAVLSAGANIQRDNEGKPVQVQVVNLLVTPQQAEVLSLASNETRIQLVLRNPLDTDLAKPPGSAMAKLFADGNAAPKPVVHAAPPRMPAPVVQKPAVPRYYLVEVLNGSTRKEEKFNSPEENK